MSNKVIAVIDNEYYVDDREFQEIIDDCNAYILGSRDLPTAEAEKGLIKQFEKLLETLHYCEDDEELEDAIPNCFNKAVNEDDCKRIHEAADDEKDFIGVCLGVYFDVPFKVVAIRGCNQGDYATLFIPKTESHTIIDLIEAMYFGTGVGVYYSDNTLCCKSPQDVFDFYENCFYTPLFDPDDIKKEIAEMSGWDKEDIDLYKIDGYQRVPIFRRADE